MGSAADSMPGTFSEQHSSSLPRLSEQVVYSRLSQDYQVCPGAQWQLGMLESVAGQHNFDAGKSCAGTLKPY